MSTPILLLAICAAVLHAAWNLGSRHYRDRAGFTWGIGVWGAVWGALALPFFMGQIEWGWIPLAGIALAGIASTSKLIFWAVLNPGAKVGFDWRRLSVNGVPTWKMASFGFCAFGAYVIIICALIYADAGRVLAVGNLSVVLGAVGGILFYRERSDIAVRVTGLLLTISGITLLRLF